MAGAEKAGYGRRQRGRERAGPAGATGWMIRKVAAFLCATATAAAVASFLYYWEPTRVVWKSWITSDRYRFAEIHPRFRQTDPASLIRIRTAQDAARIRQALIETIWGPAGMPRDALPQRVQTDIPLEDTPALAARGLPFGAFRGTGNLAGLDRIRIAVSEFYAASVYLFRPRTRNGRLVLYHNGHGGRGTFIDQKRLIAQLIGDGYAALALNLVAQGDSDLHRAHLPGIGWYELHPWRLFDLVERPLRYYLDPVVIGLNHALKRDAYRRVDMIGFSAGAWVTVLASAVDPRIRASYTVAGPYPLYLRSGEEGRQSPRPQYYRPLLQAANYLEMFVLAAFGEERRQLQIFNRYDGCCFVNRKGKLYEAAVKQAVTQSGGGRFDVVIDETHTRHQISPYALDRIRRDLAAP